MEKKMSFSLAKSTFKIPSSQTQFFLHPLSLILTLREKLSREQHSSIRWSNSSEGTIHNEWPWRLLIVPANAFCHFSHETFYLVSPITYRKCVWAWQRVEALPQTCAGQRKRWARWQACRRKQEHPEESSPAVLRTGCRGPQGEGILSSTPPRELWMSSFAPQSVKADAGDGGAPTRPFVPVQLAADILYGMPKKKKKKLSVLITDCKFLYNKASGQICFQ